MKLLKQSFVGQPDQVVAAILKDNNYLLHAIKLFEEANSIQYHTPALCALRIQCLNILTGYIRDFNTAKHIIDHLKEDFENNINVSRKNEILYNTNLFINLAVNSEYEKAIPFAEKTLNLLELEKEMYEEKMRLISNLIQYYSLTGSIDKSQKFVEMGAKLFPYSKSDEHNALYVYATTLFLLDKGKVEKTINLIHKYQDLLEKQAVHHPSLRFFILNQLAEAYIKKKEINESKKALVLAEKYGKEFYADENNAFFGKLCILKAICLLDKPLSFKEAKSLILKGLATYEKFYKGSDKHRGQAFGHFQLGQLLHQHQEYDEAKAQYLKSEVIFEKIFKNMKMDDVSELYKQLAILGIDTKDEALAHVYIKKQISTFGLSHLKTKEMMSYLNAKGLALPF